MRDVDDDFPEISDAERLTLLAYVLKSVVTPGDPQVRPLVDYVADLGVPIFELLATAAPMSTDHYSLATLEHLRALLDWNRRPARTTVRG